MGNYMDAYVTKPDTTPSPVKEPSFDPNFGFPNGRKERGNYLFIYLLICFIIRLIQQLSRQ